MQIEYKGDERLRVIVTSGDIQQPFLYDTSAQRTCMQVKAFKWIFGTVNCERLPEKDQRC